MLTHMARTCSGLQESLNLIVRAFGESFCKLAWRMIVKGLCSGFDDILDFNNLQDWNLQDVVCCCFATKATVQRLCHEVPGSFKPE